ncbi:type I 3-dehydroquinate dehydratase [Chloroflexota bacterium]
MKPEPKICAVITSADPEAIAAVAPLADLFEVRIDLIGADWQRIASRLPKPWIACNRCADEGGKWQGTEKERIETLLGALDLGAAIIDLELGTENLDTAVAMVKKQGSQCLLSFHSLVGTPLIETLRDIVNSQLAAGADISKVATTALTPADNLTVLQLIRDYPEHRIVSFAMGDSGLVSRVLCPLVGGGFTYAAIAPGRESAPGQITVTGLRKIYELL